jgi:hypothetical protein
MDRFLRVRNLILRQDRGHAPPSILPWGGGIGAPATVTRGRDEPANGARDHGRKSGPVGGRLVDGVVVFLVYSSIRLLRVGRTPLV